MCGYTCELAVCTILKALNLHLYCVRIESLELILKLGMGQSVAIDQRLHLPRSSLNDQCGILSLLTTTDALVSVGSSTVP
jgi:hypothetical protein